MPARIFPADSNILPAAASLHVLNLKPDKPEATLLLLLLLGAAQLSPRSPSNLSRSRPGTPSSPHVTPRAASSPSLAWRQQAAAQLSNEYQSYPFGESIQLLRVSKEFE
jgi:hypothetical protein